MKKSNSLHGKSPLDIYQNSASLRIDDYMRTSKAPAPRPIERLLLRYGAYGTRYKGCGGKDLFPDEPYSDSEGENSEEESTEKESAERKSSEDGSTVT